MVEELKSGLHIREPARRKVGYVVLDKNLICQRHSPGINQWFTHIVESLVGSHLIDMLPELGGNERSVQQLFVTPEKLITIPQIRRIKKDGDVHTFDLQIEVHANEKDALLLTIVDVTPHTRFSRYPDLDHKDGHAETAENHVKQNDLEMLAQQNRVLQLLNRAGRILTATLEMDEVLERVLQVTTQIIGAEGSSVWLWGEEAPECLECRAAFHPGNVSHLLGARVRQGQGIVGWVAQTGESTVVINPHQDPRFYNEIDAKGGFTTKSLVAAPLHWRDKVVGVLEVVNKLEGHFTNDDLAIVETLAASASIALENARLVETLQRRMSDLQKQNEELDAFDHTVAHDLQNPLALVVGFADLLQHAGDRIDVEERDRAVYLIMQNAHRMSNIIQELLMLSSVRKSGVETHPMDMQEIVTAALERLKYLMQEYDVELILPQKWPVALGYAPWIEEVWENYLSNALKYGGDPPYIELGSTILADGKIQFWVRDNGSGLTAEKQAMLFTPFTKLSGIRVTGHGLGLSIVRRIMEKLGGDVGVESELGSGSVFSFTLPPADQ